MKGIVCNSRMLRTHRSTFEICEDGGNDSSDLLRLRLLVPIVAFI